MVWEGGGGDQFLRYLSCQLLNVNLVNEMSILSRAHMNAVNQGCAKKFSNGRGARLGLGLYIFFPSLLDFRP